MKDSRTKPQKQVNLTGVDPPLLQFSSETRRFDLAVNNRATRPEQIRDHMELVAAYGKATAHVPHRVTRLDGVLTLPGRELIFRLYRPAHHTGALSLLMYAHGGGWVAGSIYTHDALCAEISLRTGRAVVSVQYRRAPENPYPAAHDDFWEAWHWFFRHGQNYGLRTDTIALAGDSAGGHLALGCALRHRRHGASIPAPDCLLLWYPNTDRRADTPSRKAYAYGFGLSVDDMEFFWRCFEGEHEHPQDNDVLYPGHVEIPTGLPPAVIVTAEFDILRDEAECFATRMKEAGNRVELLRATSMLHGFARLHEESPTANWWVRRGCKAFVDIVDLDRSEIA